MQTTAPAARSSSAAHPWIVGVVALVAIAGVAAIWCGLSVIVRSPAAWMAVVTAFDAALLLRLANQRPGRARAVVACAITATTVVVAGYLVATAEIGLSMGLRPAEAVWRMSPGLAWLYLRANLGWVEMAWAAAGLGVAWKAGK